MRHFSTRDFGSAVPDTASFAFFATGLVAFAILFFLDDKKTIGSSSFGSETKYESAGIIKYLKRFSQKVRNSYVPCTG